MQSRRLLLEYTQCSPNALGSLERRLKKHEPELYSSIVNNWHFEHSPVSFLEQVYQYLWPTELTCAYGGTRTFEYFRTGYRCQKGCRCTQLKHRATMLARYGAESPLQVASIQQKQQQTLLARYGTTKLHQVNVEQKQATCQARYSANTPLESPAIYAKTRATFVNRFGVEHPFVRINANPEYSARATATRLANSKELEPHKHDVEAMIAAVEQYSYTKAGELLGLYPQHIRNCIARAGRDDLLPCKSSYERLVAEYLTKLGVEYTANTRRVIAPYELDFYLQDANAAIEIHGLRWHSAKHGGKDQHYHINKWQRCQQQGITLLQIWTDEFDKYQATVLGEFRKLAGVPGKTVNTSTTQHNQFDQATQFLQQYCVHGAAEMTECWLTLNDNQVIAVIALNNTHIQRMQVHPDYSDTVLADLFAQTDITYATATSDNRHATHQALVQLGFTATHTTPPAKWHTTPSYSRRTTNPGTDYVWDCGTTEWTFTAGDNT